jgi:hypothetical protein
MRREHGSNDDKTSETGEKIAGFKHFQSKNKSESENNPQIEWAQSESNEIAGEQRQ